MTSTCKGTESRPDVSPDIAGPKLKLPARKAEASITENKQTLKEKKKDASNSKESMETL